MEHAKDKELGKMAVSLQWIELGQLEHCLRIQEEARQKGRDLPLVWWLERCKYLNAEQINVLEQKCAALHTWDGGECATWGAETSKEMLADVPAISRRDSVIAPEQGSSPQTVTDDGVLPTTHIEILTPQAVSPGQNEMKMSPTFPTAKKPSGSLEENTAALGRYQIRKELGQGGMGKVYLAFDPENNRLVALKVLLAEETASTKAIKRFWREAKTMGKLSHPHIVQLYEIGQEQGHDFFTMEFIEGTTLREMMRQKPLSIEQIVNVMMQVCSAVHYAHQHGVIHRDLKPANVMIDKNGQAKVLDFGLAKVSQASTNLTKSGTLMGTLQYMPPEQASGESKGIDARSDVYALGATLYELLTGQPSVSGAPAEILYKILSKELIPPSQLNPNVPPELEKICLKAMEKDKDMRYQSADLLKQDLKRFSQGKDISASHSHIGQSLKKSARRHRLAFLMLAFLPVIAALLAGGGWYLMRIHRQNKAEEAYRQGMLWVQQRQYPKALTSLLQSVALDPQLADAYRCLGEVYYQEKEMDKALDAWQKAIRLNPKLDIAYYDLGVFYMHRRNRRKATPYFQKYLELTPHDDRANEVREWLQGQ